MNLLDKLPYRKKQKSQLQQINDLLEKRGKEQVAGWSTITMAKQAERKLTDVQQATLDVLGKDAEGLWLDWDKYKKLLDEKKALEHKIVDMKPGIFNVSLPTKIWHMARFVILVICASLVILGALYWGPILELETQKYYNKELLDAEIRKMDAIISGVEAERDVEKRAKEYWKEEADRLYQEWQVSETIAESLRRKIEVGE